MSEDRMLSDEILLGLINKNSGGGGGGTDDYNDLKNQPQINGNTMIGNKTASDLGLVAAETGKGLSSNDYTNEDKAIVGGVTAALADKQNVLTAGDYISIDAHNNISVNRELTPHQTSYRIKGISQYTMNITKYIDGVQESSTDYGYSQGTTRTIDDAFTINDTYSGSDGYIWQFVWLKDSTTHDKDYTVSYRAYNAAFDFTEVFNDEDLSGYKLVIKSEMDAALATKADLTDLAPAFSTATAYTVGQYVSYDGNIYKCTSAHSAGAWAAGDFTLVAVGSELESKQNATDNNLQTTDKTVVGAVNELKSGLTNKEPLGGTITGNKVFKVGGNLELRTDAEGGNINIVSDNNVQFEIDAHTDILRVWSDKSGSYKFLTWNGNEDINLNDLVNKEPLNGTDTGNKIFHVGDKLYLKTDNEGGNIVIKSPTNITYEADAYNGSFRFRTTKSGEGKSVTWDGMRNVNLNAMPSIYHGTVTSDSVYGSIGVPNATNSLIVLVGNDSKSYHLDYNNPNVFILRDENNVAVTDTSVEIMAMYVQ